VSGKDSLNNEYTGTDGQRHAVPPTLVVTAVAHVPDVGACVSAELTEPGSALLLVGETRPEFAGSHLDLVLGVPADVGTAPQPDPDAPARYRRLHAAIRAGLVRGCHDVSEGGLAVALAELCIAGRLGAVIDELGHPDPTTALFAESTGRLVVEVRPQDVARFLDVAGPAQLLGTVSAEPALALPRLPAIPVDDLIRVFRRIRVSAVDFPDAKHSGDGKHSDGSGLDP
jgi:phosphoribosylformylglycinamidine synthase